MDLKQSDGAQHEDHNIALDFLRRLNGKSPQVIRGTMIILNRLLSDNQKLSLTQDELARIEEAELFPKASSVPQEH